MVFVSSAPTERSLSERLQSTRKAATQLAGIPTALKDAALAAIAEQIELHSAEILQANHQDLHHAAEMVTQGTLSGAAYARLKLDEVKIASMAAGVRDVIRLPDPIGRDQFVRELDEGLILRRRTCPLGVLGVIFESRPDAVTQIVALSLKTGNAVVLKGGAEAVHSCRMLVQIIHQALTHFPEIPADGIQLLTTREETRTMLAMDDYLDLIIPRGSKSFVQFVQANTRIPVLGHADGICHLYVDAAANVEQAVRLTIDSKVQYPSACNAIETLLVHAAVASSFLPKIVNALQAEGVEVRGCEKTAQLISINAASERDWGTEYGELILSIKVVESLTEALQHIQNYGSHHTEAIVTEDPGAAQTFLQQVDAAGVFHNASTRFADGYRYGFGAEVGISTQKLPPRGPVGMEGLVTYKYQLSGQGQVVSDYVGIRARPFRHRDLPTHPD